MTLEYFEAGISQPGEMEKLQKVIDPEIGVVNLYMGKLMPKALPVRNRRSMKNFGCLQIAVYWFINSDDGLLNNRINIFVKDSNPELKLISWGRKTLM
jgi:hypothetical protein